MKKSVIMLAVAVMMLSTMGVAFADASWGPAAIYADIVNKTEEEVYAAKLESGDTFGEMAEAAGVYDEFKAAAMIGKEAMLNALVAEGKLTEAEAKEILADLAECDGEKSDILKNSGLFGLKDGSGFGSGQGQGNGAKTGNGGGLGAGAQNRGGNSGNGQRIMDGSCIID
jgi:hypothetical protein